MTDLQTMERELGVVVASANSAEMVEKFDAFFERHGKGSDHAGLLAAVRALMIAALTTDAGTASFSNWAAGQAPP